MRLRRGEVPARQHLADLRERVGALDRQASRLCESLSPAELGWRPASGWSVLQVFDHVRLFNEMYLPSIRAAVRSGSRAMGRTGEGSANGTWAPTLFGGALVRLSSAGSRLRLKTLPRLRPSADPDPGAPAAYRRQLAELARLLLEAQGVDLAGTTLPHPMWSRLSLNLGEAFEILVAHAERHMGQAGRTLARPERPRPMGGPEA